MTESFTNLGKGTTYRFKKLSKNKPPNIIMPRNNIIKLLKTKGKKSKKKQKKKTKNNLPEHIHREMTHCLLGQIVSNSCDFSLEAMEARRKEHIFQVLRERNCEQNPISSENILQKWKWNEDTLRWRKTEWICCQQT